nr:phosphohistidine phosphatase SixA [uncultured Haemophilus sp.]
MNIWIMRHGEAGFNAPNDAERALTEQGRNAAFSQGKWLGEYFTQHQIRLDKVLVSPYLRAKQTLEEVAKGMQAVNFFQNITNLIEEWDEVTPSGSPDIIQDYLAFLNEEGAKQILIVSHLPLVFDLVQMFTQYQQSVHFYPAVIAGINWNGQKGNVLFEKTP